MKLVTIRLEDTLMGRLTAQAQALQLSKTAYIRKAIEQMSQQIESQALKESLMRASLACRAESRRICQEFSKIERDENFDSTY